ncbi:hypothetical protein [Enemella evansiae]|uniref:hypothetical protein n=1 Tax=Enemella evansiae TaxID=2016499 RepID=UPI000B9761BB|nr:hypothetical protein [Enemella evansiae]OYO05452.1 hypothetical protein CGZ97_01600 [Enemella evansiae]
MTSYDANGERDDSDYQPGPLEVKGVEADGDLFRYAREEDVFVVHLNRELTDWELLELELTPRHLTYVADGSTLKFAVEIRPGTADQLAPHIKQDVQMLYHGGQRRHGEAVGYRDIARGLAQRVTNEIT